MRFPSFIVLLGGLCAALSPVRAVDQPLDLGANFNEHLHIARVPLLDITGVRWIRGFLPAGEFLDIPRTEPLPADYARRDLATDPGIATFQAAAASGRKIAITLKWDFKRTHWRVPAPGSEAERKAFAWAVDVVHQVRPDLLLLINEIYIDTEEEDMRAGSDGVVPMVRFLQRLAAHVAAAHLQTPEGKPLPVSCGGFTRIDTPAMQNNPTTHALLDWLATTSDITHVNFHLHEANLDQFESALQFMHTHLPKRPFIITEFSLVWAFREGLKETLGVNAAGRDFARRYQRDSEQTVAAYLSAVAAQPVSEEELHAFLATRSWFDPQALEKMCRLMEKNGVVLATYAYLQASSGLEKEKSPIAEGQAPWRLNPIFQERHACAPDGSRLPVQFGFYDTFVKRQQSRE